MAEKRTYQDMQTELQAVLQSLQADDIDIDKATESYARGLELVKEMQTYLDAAENKITVLKQRFDEAA